MEWNRVSCLKSNLKVKITLRGLFFINTYGYCWYFVCIISLFFCSISEENENAEKVGEKEKLAWRQEFNISGLVCLHENNWLSIFVSLYD